MSLPKWRVHKLGLDSWIARREDCPAADHFCWRSLMPWSLQCKIFVTHTKAVKHAHAMAYEEQFNRLLDRLP